MAKKLFINTRKTGWNPEHCGKTMTVAQLIEYLQEFPQDYEVYLKHEDGIMYDSIWEKDFEEEDYEIELNKKWNSITTQ